MTMQVIQHIELSSAADNITFSSIPQGFTDLMLKLSLRSTRTGFASATYINFNSNGYNSTGRVLYGNGSAVGSYTYTDGTLAATSSAANTASTFGSIEIYIPNYTSSNNKSYSVDYVLENNATTAEQGFNAGLWANSAAITSITVDDFSTNQFVAGSSATLFGITRGSDGITTVS